MGKQRKKNQDEGGVDPNGWMATFSDLNFLMITFFVLLLSMSSMDERQFSDVFGDEISPADEMLRPEPPMGRSPMPAIMPSQGSWVGYPQNMPVDEAPGSHGRHDHEGVGHLQKTQATLAPDPRGEQTDENIRRAIERVRDLLEIESVTEDEIRISVNDALFFEGEELHLSPQAQDVLRSIADLTNEINGELMVQAHRGQWDLAAKRSASVAVLMVRYGVPGERLSADVTTGPDGFLDFALKRATSKRNTETGEGAR
jgi:flagellar motor protein MotB